MNGYYEYDLKIYPRKIWVSWAISEEEVNEFWQSSDHSLLVLDDEYYGCTFQEVLLKESDNQGTYPIGELIIFWSAGDMDLSNIVHEASHACDAVEEVTGITHGDEPSAYLLSYIAKCIQDAKDGGKNADKIIFKNKIQ